MISRRLLAAVLVPVVAVLVLAGCTETPPGGENTTNYETGLPYKEIKPAARKAPVTFTGVTDTGAKISSADLLGTVHVLNFWYAGCGPCRVEAPRLQSVYTGYDGKIPFIGVNTYDQKDVALTFEKSHNVSYPSIIDVNDTAVQFAFSASVSANAVPTTLVIDKHGRVAARVTGLLEDSSILKDLIDTVVSEGQ